MPVSELLPHATQSSRIRSTRSNAVKTASEISPASDWCQRWTERRHNFRHRSEGGFDARQYEVAEVAEASAKAFVVDHHYSRSYPAARLRYGLYDRQGELLGVAVLSVPVRKAVLSGPFPTLVPYVESLELGRFVLLDAAPANAESWFLARAFDLAQREGLRGVVSFSDPLPRQAASGETVFAGHVGTIYQASNAVYTGRGEARRLMLLPDGRALNARSLSKVRNQERGHQHVEELLCRLGASPRGGVDPREWLVGALASAGVREVCHPGNHRYLFRLGSRRWSIALGGLSLPYPKKGL